MNWIDKLERKYGRFGIQNLTMYVIICYVVGYVLVYIIRLVHRWNVPGESFDIHYIFFQEFYFL